MKPLPLVLLAAASGALSGLVAGFAARSLASQPAAAEAAADPARDLVREELAAMGRRQDELEEALTRVSEELAAPSSSARLPLGEIEAAVQRALASAGVRGSGGSDSSPRGPAPAAGGSGAGEESEPFDVQAAVARLVAGDFEGGDFAAGLSREEYWQELRETGHLDEVVAAFEERAELYPTDPDVQVDLGEAYLQKIFEVGNGPLAGVWATKADDAFDAALAADEHHWEARFQKAASLSFWPPVFGKQSEAIHQFEILTEQQELAQPSPKHAQTYLLLGNLYQQNGRPEKALEAWKRGLDRFPENEALIDQLEVAE